MCYLATCKIGNTQICCKGGCTSAMQNHRRFAHKICQKSQLILESFGNNTPTSIWSERAFSTACLFMTNIRSRLTHNTLDSLCFLRNYFKIQMN